MRFFRLAGLVVTLFAAYSVFLLIDPNLLARLQAWGPWARFAEFVPLLSQTDFAPLLTHLARYHPLVVGLALLTFGLLTSPWPARQRTQQPSEHSSSDPSPLPPRWVGRLLLLLALGVTAGAVTLRWQQGQENLTIHLLWAVGIFGYLLACSRLDHSRPAKAAAANRGRNWPAVGFLLLVTLCYLGWGLLTAPLVVNAEEVVLGVAARTFAQEATPQIFALPDPTMTTPAAANPSALLNLATNLPLVLTALLHWLTGDLVMVMRLLGLGSTLLFGWSLWLVSRELFRRPVHILAEVSLLNSEGIRVHPREDNGAALALTAMTLALSHRYILGLSSHPFQLATAAAGLLGGWALLLAWRQRNRLALGISGCLFGIAVTSHLTGWSFVGMALCWWLGIGVATQGWLPHRVGRTAKKTQQPLRVYDFLLWLLGIGVVAALFFWNLAEAGVPTRAFFTTDFAQQFTSLGRTLLLLDIVPVSGEPTSSAIPLMYPWLLPLIGLALGALLFNLDRKPGWMILSWIGIAMAGASMVGVAAQGGAMLLPLVSALAVALAFALDRLYITLLRAGGGWLQQFISYGLLGLLLWVVIQNGIASYATALRQADSLSALGQTLRQSEQGPIVIIDPAQRLADPTAAATLDVLTAGRSRASAATTIVAQLPTDLAPNTLLIFFPDDPTLQGTTLQSQYPQGSLTTVRAINANPLLYLYQLP